MTEGERLVSGELRGDHRVSISDFRELRVLFVLRDV